ncbi:hypothetical protein ACUUL3_08775 [Thiovibrio sp. JS02]
MAKGPTNEEEEDGSSSKLISMTLLCCGLGNAAKTENTAPCSARETPKKNSRRYR